MSTSELYYQLDSDDNTAIFIHRADNVDATSFNERVMEYLDAAAYIHAILTYTADSPRVLVLHILPGNIIVSVGVSDADTPIDSDDIPYVLDRILKYTGNTCVQFAIIYASDNATRFVDGVYATTVESSYIAALFTSDLDFELGPPLHIRCSRDDGMAQADTYLNITS